jgi:hypothetical protein
MVQCGVEWLFLVLAAPFLAGAQTLAARRRMEARSVRPNWGKKVKKGQVLQTPLTTVYVLPRAKTNGVQI